MPSDPPWLWRALPATNSRTHGCDSNSQLPHNKIPRSAPVYRAAREAESEEHKEA